MPKSSIRRAVNEYLKTTTLHGFKYLHSPHRIDKIWWGWWCIVCGVCAGALCAVLWARFLQVPALLTLHSELASATLPLPTISVCLPSTTSSRIIAKHLSGSSPNFRSTLSRILRHQITTDDELLQLDTVFKKNNTTLSETLFAHTPPCREIVKRCRLQYNDLPCESLFIKEINFNGACCVMHSDKMTKDNPIGMLNLKYTIMLAMQCSDDSLFGCDIVTQYQSEEWAEVQHMTPGYTYLAQLASVSIQDTDTDKLLDGGCNSNPGYSRKRCLAECAERHCRCRDPMPTAYGQLQFEPCPFTRVPCLRDFNEEFSCRCIPTCNKITSDMALEGSRFAAIQYTFDPFYKNLNTSLIIVMDLKIKVMGSQIFKRRPTETWFTLLSSLGGVFNMFLGVGLFSALELFHLAAVRLPAAITRRPEMHGPWNSSNH